MAGFMSGFGSAFSQSFNKARDIRAQREDDMFKIKYQELSSRRDNLEKQKKQQAKDIEASKSLARMYTGSEETWSEIYKMRANGIDDSAIVDFLEKNDAEITPMDAASSDGSGPAAPGTDLASSAASSVDAQMQESGMQPPADGGLFAGIKGALGKDAQNERMTGRIDSRLGEATGMSQEEIDSTMSSSEPGDPLAGMPSMQVKWKPKSKTTDMYKANGLNEAMVQLAQAERSGDPELISIATDVVNANMAAEEIEANNRATAEGRAFKPTMAAYQDQNGQWRYLRKSPGDNNNQWRDIRSGEQIPSDKVKVFNADAMEDLSEITKATREGGLKYGQKATQLVSSINEVSDMVKIVEQNPTVASAAGALAKSTDNIVRDVSGIISLFRQDTAEALNSDGILKTNPGVIEKLAGYEKDLESKYEKFVSSSTADNFEKLAVARSLLEIKAIKFAYAQAAAVGQTGNGVAAREFERFYQTAINPNSTAWKQEMADFVLGQYRALKQEGSMLNEDMIMQEFELRHGAPSPLKPAPDLDMIISKDPEAATALDMFLTGADTVDENVTNTDQIGNTPEGMVPVGRSPDGKIVYQDKKTGKKFTQ